jgi:hypothetical protein
VAVRRSSPYSLLAFSQPFGYLRSAPPYTTTVHEATGRLRRFASGTAFPETEGSGGRRRRPNTEPAQATISTHRRTWRRTAWVATMSLKVSATLEWRSWMTEVPEAWGYARRSRPFQPAAFDCAVATDPKENLYVANGGPADPGVQYGVGHGQWRIDVETAIEQWRIVANTRCSRSNGGRYSGCFRLYVPAGRPLFCRS